MKKILIFSLLLLIGAFSCTTVQAATEAEPYVTDLIAGQHIDAGDVLVWHDGNDVHVVYRTSGWIMTETHLHIATTPEGVPQKNGNPIPGQFDYKDSYDSSEAKTLVEYVVTVEGWTPGDPLFIAAHAVVEGGDCVLEAMILPETVYVHYDKPGPVSYFLAHVETQGPLYGPHESWCIDQTRSTIDADRFLHLVYKVDTLPSGLVDGAENLDLVTYVLNNYMVGMPSPNTGVYSMFEIQNAIWNLLKGEDATQYLTPVDLARVAEILVDARANGEGYTPGPGGKMIIVLVPVNPENHEEIVAQLVLITVELPPCGEGEETAWGFGPGFTGKNWAMYIEYPEPVSPVPTVVEEVLNDSPDPKGKAWGPPNKENRTKKTWGKTVSEERGKPKRK